MKQRASVTVMMTMVITIILAFMLVVLEHDYRACLKTLEIQTFDKALESTMGNFYAPLWSKYGLMAVVVGDGFYYENAEQLEENIRDNYDFSFNQVNTGLYNGFLWYSKASEVKLNKRADLTSDSGQAFINQITKNVNYDLAFFACEELENLSKNSKIDLFELTKDAKDELKTPPEKDEDAGEEKPKESSSYSKIKKTLKAFLNDGFAGWWFEDTSYLSGIKINKSNLPSSKYLKDNSEDDLFKEIKITEEEIDDESYLDKLANEEVTEKFNTALNSISTGYDKKIKLCFYANQYFGNYVHHKPGSKLDYEQEYLAFGSNSDETNVKRSTWGIFALREGMNLIAITKSPKCQEMISDWVGILDDIPILKYFLKALIISVWSIQNALVETAAICRGKSVDFYTNVDNLSVKVTEILTMSKDKIQAKAKAYKPSAKLKLGYDAYMIIFMYMANTEKLAFRMMDLIELNMQKNVNENFKIKNCVVGFSANASVSAPSKYLKIPYLSIDSFKYLNYKDKLESAIYLGD